jgi:pimeloyl-ACP methyl ester carboxylesterase
MQRPVMNPTFFDDSPTSGSRRRRLRRLVGSAIFRPLRMGFRFLMYDPMSSIRGFRVEEGTPTSRFMRGILYRLAFVPVLMAATACAIVWTSTHPRPVLAEVDPSSVGIHYAPLAFVGADQVPLEGWLVSAINAQQVLEEKENILRKKSPGVVLVHDIGQRREQMLPLIKPLHEAGFVVLALNLRGGGLRAVKGETFGLRESDDVRAAVAVLRRQPFVDTARIAIVGWGTGATAALLAARTDPQIHAVVAERPVRDAQELVQFRIMPEVPYLSWLAPLCKWTFEMSYGVDAEETEMANFKKLFASRPVLLVDSGGMHADPSDRMSIEQIRSFLTASLPEKNAVADVK